MEIQMKLLSAALAALAIAITPALAGSDNLAAGKPAGIHAAQMGDGNTMLLIGGAALVAVGVVLATQGNGSGPTSQVNTVTTSATNP
jgi:hypothetical protein